MREFVANFQQKHGQQVPMPKIYGDEDSSDSEGLELADGTKVGKKTTDGAGGSGGGKPRKKPAGSGVAVELEDRVVVAVPAQVAAAVPAQVVVVAQAGPEVTAQVRAGGVEMMMVMRRTQTNAGRQGMRVDPQDQSWPVKNHTRRAQFTPRSTESCQSSTSLA